MSFALSNELLKSAHYWPELTASFKRINQEPEHLLHSVPTIIDDDPTQTLNNLPRVDYDDTGFVPRPKLEADLKKKILGRNPIITVLGRRRWQREMGLALQTAYRLLNSSDHNFDDQNVPKSQNLNSSRNYQDRGDRQLAWNIRECRRVRAWSGGRSHPHQTTAG